MKKNIKGDATIVVLAAMAIIAGITWLVKPKLLPGASRRADASTQATANLESANKAQGAAAAASVVKIGEANADAPASPSRDFIAREVPLALTFLAPPDPAKLVEAERRKVAIMTGQLDESRRLYGDASKQSAQMQKERDGALAARHSADLALEQAAAAEHARTVQLLGAIAFAVLVLAAWLYLKFHSVGIADLGTLAADLKAGVNPLHALDAIVDRRLHDKVKRAAKLATDS